MARGDLSLRNAPPGFRKSFGTTYAGGGGPSNPARLSASSTSGAVASFGAPGWQFGSPGPVHARQVSLCPIFTGAASSAGWGASLGNPLVHGSWDKSVAKEGIKWKESRALFAAPEPRKDGVAGKLVLSRMGNSAAAAYAYYAPGRSLVLTTLARRVTEIETRLQRTRMDLRFSGQGTSAADAISRYTLRPWGRDSHPDRDVGWDFRGAVSAKCGRMAVDMTARDESSNAWCEERRFPLNSAIEGPLPSRRLRCFFRIDGIGLVIDRLMRVRKARPAICPPTLSGEDTRRS